MAVDLTALDAANSALQKDPKAAMSTKNFGAASTDAIHALNDVIDTSPPTPNPEPPTNGGSVPSNGATDAVADFGFVGDNDTDNTAAWQKYLGAVADRRANPHIYFRPGLYAMDEGQWMAGRNMEFIRITGPTPPIYNQSPVGALVACFVFRGRGIMFDCDPKEGTLQSGIYFEYVNVLNEGDSGNIAWKIDHMNNWRIIRCGSRYFGVTVETESNPDNAHGACIDCMIDIPPGKVGYRIVGNTSWQSSGAGFAVRGGSISGGGEGSIGVLGEKWSDSATLTSDLKIDGCHGGGVVWSGRNLKVAQVRFEGCGTNQQPQIDIRHDGSFQNSGRGNQISQVHLIGRSPGELFGRFGEGTFLNVVRDVYVENGAGKPWWIDEGHDNYVDAPSIMG